MKSFVVRAAYVNRAQLHVWPHWITWNLFDIDTGMRIWNRLKMAGFIHYTYFFHVMNACGYCNNWKILHLLLNLYLKKQI